MRFYTRSHKHFCGIDLRARSMYMCITDCITDADNEVLLHRNMKATCEAFAYQLRGRPVPTQEAGRPSPR